MRIYMLMWVGVGVHASMSISMRHVLMCARTRHPAGGRHRHLRPHHGISWYHPTSRPHPRNHLLGLRGLLLRHVLPHVLSVPDAPPRMHGARELQSVQPQRHATGWGAAIRARRGAGGVSVRNRSIRRLPALQPYSFCRRPSLRGRHNRTRSEDISPVSVACEPE